MGENTQCGQVIICYRDQIWIEGSQVLSIKSNARKTKKAFQNFSRLTFPFQAQNSRTIEWFVDMDLGYPKLAHGPKPSQVSASTIWNRAHCLSYLWFK
jgi:hypothetical protein